mmetsp:Transcript_10086/g.21794  ORF Transcript_10086/g.21794 Transcript_10086/m.21794 type:complete len:294 (-) Transcript_10086:1621-2502(-)
MGFVHHGDAPRNLAHYIEITNEGVVSRDEYIKLEILRRVRAVNIVPFVLAHDIAPNALSIMVDTASQVGPTLKFAPPVLNGGERNDHQKGAVDLLNTMKMLKIGDDLYCFTKPHLVGKYGGMTLIPAAGKPVDTVDLIISQFVVVFVDMWVFVVVQLVAEFKEGLFALLVAPCTRRRCFGDYRIGSSESPPIPTDFISKFFVVLPIQNLTDVLERNLQSCRGIFGLCPDSDNFIGFRVYLLDLTPGELERFVITGDTSSFQHLFVTIRSPLSKKCLLRLFFFLLSFQSHDLLR